MQSLSVAGETIRIVRSEELPPLREDFLRRTVLDSSGRVHSRTFRVEQSYSIEVGKYRFDFDPRAAEISWAGARDDDTELQRLLLDVVAPELLAARGTLVVHASGVVDGRGAVLFVGPSGSGKSTLATGLVQRGAKLVGDDFVIVRGLDVVPTHSSIRLWRDSLDALAPDGERVRYGSGKSRVHLASAADCAAKIRSIYVLAEASDDIRIESLSRDRAFAELARNSFRPDPTDDAMLTRHVDAIAALVSAVPAFTVSFPPRYDRLAVLASRVMNS